MDQINKVEKIRCDACPVMCYIAEGKSGACDRYANKNGQIIRKTISTRLSYLNHDHLNLISRKLLSQNLQAVLLLVKQKQCLIRSLPKLLILVKQS